MTSDKNSWGKLPKYTDYKYEYFKCDELQSENTHLKEQIKIAREALEKILNEKNMAMQGHWDATIKIGNIAYQALAQLNEKKE